MNYEVKVALALNGENGSCVEFPHLHASLNLFLPPRCALKILIFDGQQDLSCRCCLLVTGAS